MRLYESFTIILLYEALKYVRTRCAITNLCLDNIWKCKHNSWSKQYQGHKDKYRYWIHCMEDHYNSIFYNNWSLDKPTSYSAIVEVRLQLSFIRTPRWDFLSHPAGLNISDPYKIWIAYYIMESTILFVIVVGASISLFSMLLSHMIKRFQETEASTEYSWIYLILKRLTVWINL